MSVLLSSNRHRFLLTYFPNICFFELILHRIAVSYTKSPGKACSLSLPHLGFRPHFRRLATKLGMESPSLNFDAPIIEARSLIEALEQAKDAIATASLNVQTKGVIPLGKSRKPLALIPATLVHTGEVLCPIGDGHLIWKTAAQAQALIERKIGDVERTEDKLRRALIANSTTEELISQGQAHQLADLLRNLVTSTGDSNVAEVAVDGGAFSYITETEEESAALALEESRPSTSASSAATRAEQQAQLSSDAVRRILALAESGEEEWDTSPSSATVAGRKQSAGAGQQSKLPTAAPSTGSRTLGASPLSAGSSPRSPASGAGGSASRERKGVRFAADATDVREYAPSASERMPFSRPSHAGDPGDGAPARFVGQLATGGPARATGAVEPAKPRSAASAEGAAFSGRILERKAPAAMPGAVTERNTAAPGATSAAAQPQEPRVSRFKARMG